MKFSKSVVENPSLPMGRHLLVLQDVDIAWYMTGDNTENGVGVAAEIKRICAGTDIHGSAKDVCSSIFSMNSMLVIAFYDQAPTGFMVVKTRKHGDCGAVPVLVGGEI